MDNNLVNAMRKYIASGRNREAYDCLAHIYETEGPKARPFVLAFRQVLKNSISSGHNVEGNYDIMHDTYVLTAQDSFDDFMIAIEWYRKDEEKFWLVRRTQLLPVCEQLEALLSDDLDELFLSCPPRIGKALANDTPILTRNGWKNHGDLVVGDEVIGMDGKFKKVIAVHPKCQLDVLMEFTNGEKIQCHENHEWLFYDRPSHRAHLEETRYWEGRDLEIGTPGKRGHRYHFQLPQREYVKGFKRDLPLDPYTLGVWLGDGTNQDARICGDCRDYDIIEKIQRNGWPVTWQTMHKDTGVMYYGFGFRKRLQLMGMCHSKRRTEKHIPEEYLTASVEQRLELLAGLLDTDGTLARKENRYHFTTADVELRDTFVQLIATFGWRCSVSQHDPIVSSSGIVGKHPYWDIGFCPDCYIPCALERKQIHKFSKRRAVALKSITRVEPKEGNCITVEGGMYLAGRQMIPTHNTSIVMFFIIWYMNKFPGKSNLYASFSDTVAKTFYNGVLEVLQDPLTYEVNVVFPKNRVSRTDSKDLLVDINRRKRYASLTCRSIDGTLNGSCDAEGILIADDLHSGIDEARSKEQLAKKWETVRANFLSRKKGTAKILWIGTHWSVADCISKRIEMLETEEEAKSIRYRVFNVPALNEKDESNFDYLFHKGFTTEDYKVIRASYEATDDQALWLAPYMGTPIERDGAVFSPSELRYYNGELPIDEDPDRIFMVVDPAWGGGDYVSAPVFYQYGDDLYLHDLVFTNMDKYVSEPMVVDSAIKNAVSAMYVEGTRVTGNYADELDTRLRNAGHRINLQKTTKHWSSQNGKAQRIYDKAPEIKERVIFRDAKCRDKPYQQAMQQLFGFTVEGTGKKHDDFPDSLAMGMVMATTGTVGRATVARRWF